MYVKLLLKSLEQLLHKIKANRRREILTKHREDERARNGAQNINMSTGVNKIMKSILRRVRIPFIYFADHAANILEAPTTKPPVALIFQIILTLDRHADDQAGLCP